MNGIQSGKLNPSTLSHKLRRNYYLHPKAIFEISETVLDAFLQDTVLSPTPQGQLDNLILWIGEAQTSPQSDAISKKHELAALIGVAISKDENEPDLDWLLIQTSKLAPEKPLPGDLYERRLTFGDNLAFRLTMLGWQKFDELRQVRRTTRRAFFARQFNNQILKEHVVPAFRRAVEKAGFELVDLETMHQPAGHIDNQIRAAIRTARFVIADLTHNNRGAYFEAGFGEGMGIPVIYSCEETVFKAAPPDGPHFDTRQLRTIVWTEATIPKAADDLTAMIRVTLVGEAKMED